jgi:hypothetical protein
LEQLQPLIEPLVQYLQHQLAPMSNMDYFVKYGVPIIQLIIVVLGAFAGIYKYYQSKNREISEKMLNDVYAPLYNYFVKQELFCELHGFERNVEETPILELKSKKQTTKINFQKGKTEYNTEESIVLGLTRDNFIKILNSVNIGLASKELYTLLSMYEVACHIENGKTFSDAYFKAGILKIQLENALRKEIIEGYNFYHKKLGLSRKNTTTFCKPHDSTIEFTYAIDPLELEQFKKDYSENPDKFY